MPCPKRPASRNATGRFVSRRFDGAKACSKCAARNGECLLLRVCVSAYTKSIEGDVRLRKRSVFAGIRIVARVVLAMSGGVDSSVAAHLLRRAGHDVVGLFMRHGETIETACSIEANAAGAKSSSALFPILPSVTWNFKF